MSLKTFFNKVFPGFVHFFENIFNSTELAWRHLAPEVQNAITFGSKIVAFLNTNIEKETSVLKTLILDAFPNLTEEDLKNILLKVNEKIKLIDDATDSTIEDLILAVQKYLKDNVGGEWAVASDTIAKIIAAFKAPADTKASVIIQFMLFAYQHFVKKRK